MRIYGRIEIKRIPNERLKRFFEYPTIELTIQFWLTEI
jgi:hypothetical protein